MKQYVGLDVAMEETKIHVLDSDGRRVWRGTCASQPDDIETTLRKRAPQAERIGLETGPLTTWLWTELTERGLPMVCLDARQAKRALDMRPNKTDANDAEGLAHILRSGWYREVRVKGPEAMLSRALVGARTQLTAMATDLSNQIRGVMKTSDWSCPRAVEASSRGTSAPFSTAPMLSRPLSCLCSTSGKPCEGAPRRSSAASSLRRARAPSVGCS